MKLMEELYNAKQKAASLEAAFPMPIFFFVKQYGRNLDKYLAEIVKLLAGTEKTWLYFKAGNPSMKEGLVQSFTTETEKNCELGKEYRGCIFVEFAEGTSKREDFKEFIMYLKENKGKNPYFFVATAGEEGLHISQVLEQFFFLRIVKGEKYNLEEQFQIIQDCFCEYQFQLTKDAKELFLEQCGRNIWKESDYVENCLRNIVKKIVYQKLTIDACADNQIKETDIKNLIKRMNRNKEQKIQIGFCINQEREYDYE